MLHSIRLHTFFITTTLFLAACGSSSTGGDAGTDGNTPADVIATDGSGGNDAANPLDGSGGNDAASPSDASGGNDAAGGGDSSSGFDVQPTSDSGGDLDVQNVSDVQPGPDVVTPVDADHGADACVPAAGDPAAINRNCTPDADGGAGDCPSGFVCATHSGIVITHTCQIPCGQDCDCPGTTTCMAISDKGGTTLECH